MKRIQCFAVAMAMIVLLVSAGALAGAHSGKGDGHKKMGQYSGFEGNEEALGAAVAAAIAETSPTKGPEHDFGGREKDLGLAVASAIKIMNSNSAYQHEMNDALVKMTLNFIQFAKDNDMMEAAVTEEIATQMPMMTRVRRLIDKTGNTELALIAVTEQTACFYQLVLDTQREPGKVTYKSPFATVLASTTRLGMHDLTEQEIHELWTVPRIKGAGEMMGVDLQVSEWREDGMITISLPESRVANAN
ncbi:MAG: hypothetical protein KJO76_10555 [Gammaproteobacteria bacterium]|nr:hypothetical protein [Gammaproteobacteria bacterium]MBT8443091.1 hypothetical protein [Gammaproteobacteria bacterium]